MTKMGRVLERLSRIVEALPLRALCRRSSLEVSTEANAKRRKVLTRGKIGFFFFGARKMLRKRPAKTLGVEASPGPESVSQSDPINKVYSRDSARLVQKVRKSTSILAFKCDVVLLISEQRQEDRTLHFPHMKTITTGWR